MYDNFSGPGSDWNGNCKHDSFDTYMDMKASGGSGTAGNKKNSSGGIVLYDSTEDSDGVVLIKALTVCGLCIIGIAVPVSSGMSELGTMLWLGGCIGLSLKILKNVPIREQINLKNESNAGGKENGKIE